MPSPLTEAREAVATALAGLGVTVYGAPPEVATPPAAVVVPADPWWVQATMGAARVQFNITFMATMQGANASALQRLEDLVWEGSQALEAVGVVTPATTPRIVKIGPMEVAATDVLTYVLVTTTPEADTEALDLLTKGVEA